MDFRPTLLKSIFSLFVGYILGFMVSLRAFFGSGVDIYLWAIAWMIITIIIYIIWSRFQSNNSIKPEGMAH